MEKKAYEVVTDIWPRKDPAGAGAVVELTEAEAKYSVLSGDLKLVPAEREKAPRKPKVIAPPAGGETDPGAGAGGSGEGEET